MNQGHQQTGPSDAAAATAARPSRRRRWLKRLLVAFAVFVVVLAVSAVTWTTVERRGLERRLDALRKASEPAAPADFNSAPVPDDQNAAVAFRAAGQLINRKADSWKAVDDIYQLRPPFSEWELGVLRGAVAPNAAALPLVDDAVRRPALSWGLAFQSPMIDVMLPDLSEQRAVANLLRYDGLLAHVEGDDARAVRRVSQLMALSRAVERQPTVVGHLVAGGIANLASTTVSELAPDLRIGSGSREAGEADVRDVIRQLLDEADAREGMLYGLKGDRVVASDAMLALAEGRLGGAAPGPWADLRWMGLFRPWVYRNASGSIDHYAALIRTAADTSDWPTFRDTFAANPTVTQRSPRVYLIANIFMPSGDRYVQQQYRVLAERRMAAVALAIALHRHRNGGTFPRSLSELVPDLLPGVPADPLRAGGKPLGYVNDPARPRLYHVGENGVDDGGVPVDPAKSKKENDAVSDHVMDLLHQPKPPQDGPEGPDEGYPGLDDADGAAEPQGLEPDASPAHEAPR